MLTDLFSTTSLSSDLAAHTGSAQSTQAPWGGQVILAPTVPATGSFAGSEQLTAIYSNSETVLSDAEVIKTQQGDPLISSRSFFFGHLL